MKILDTLRTAITIGTLSALALMVGCKPTPTTDPSQTGEPQSEKKTMGRGTDQTMDHNGVTSGNADPARPE